MNRRLRFVLVLVTVLALLVPALPAAANNPGQTAAPARALAKLQPELRSAAQNPDGKDAAPLFVVVHAAKGADFSAFASKVIATNPDLDDEVQEYSFPVRTAQLLELAGRADVIAVQAVRFERNGPDPLSEDERAAKPVPPSKEVLAAQRAQISANKVDWKDAKAFGDGRSQIRPMDWFEVDAAGPHKAEAAWARGWDGTGVVAEVNDDGVDWAHPDLMGRQKIYNTTDTATAVCGPKGCAAAYNGYPMAFSPFSMYLYVLDSRYGTTDVKDGFPGIHYADTSITKTLTFAAGIAHFSYERVLDYGLLSPTTTFTVTQAQTKSRVVHVGTHPDESLRDFVYGEKAAVLVGDPNVAGVYDTVWVDLDMDYDFSDEKPMTRADVTSAATLQATKNNPIGYRDLNADGKADLSAGALYFIGDGVTPLPHAWVRYVQSAAPAPGNGDLVAFDGPWSTGYSHGTQCASNVVGQGVVNGLLPAFNDLTTANKKPTGAVFGAAKNANLVDVSNIYWDFENSKLAAYTFAVYGYDGQRSTLATGAVNPLDTDGVQMTSNSYGSSNEDNDGWDFDGRYISRRIRLYGNYVSHLDSTGNGAPAYGTTTPPNTDVGIAVGASTEFGSTGWDSITNTTQIEFNEIIPFSNRGPTARGNNGVDVVANGAYAAGDEALNYFTAGRYGDPNGNLSWDSWGGTSRSAPAAMGNLALLYQAFKAANGRWPTYLEARSLFKSVATDLNYDVLTQGGGSVNSDRGTLVAAEWYGLAVTPDEWNPGAYRGADYPAFAHVLKPGESDTTAITVTNTGIAPITAQISLENPRLIRSDSFTYSITPAMFAAKSTENFYKAPQFILPITAQAEIMAANPWWNGHDIPAGTDLMVVTMRYPFSQLDNNADYAANNRWRLAVYGWTDINSDHNVWDDLNGNGVVNYAFNPADPATTSDGGIELRWDDPTTEIDRWEYARVGYSRPGGNVLQIAVHDPRDQMKDGWFIGLTQYTATALNTTDFQFTIEYYENQQAPSWLSTDTAELTVPAGGTGVFNITAAAGALPAGMYEGSVKIIDPGATVSGQVTGPNGTVTLTNEVFPAHTSVVPVVMTVAPDYSAGMTFGGQAVADAQNREMYNNGVVRGYFDWTWRAESGDWRFFMFDNTTPVLPGTKLLVKNEWDDVAPPTDIDTIVLGPALDVFTSPAVPPATNPNYDPAYYGPYTLATVGQSPNANTSAGVWRFNTATGGAEEWVSAPFAEGLHAVALHNVLFEGDQLAVPFTTTVGTIRAVPFAINLQVDSNVGQQTVEVSSTLALPGIGGDAYGLSAPFALNFNLPAPTGALYELTHQFTVAHAASLRIETDSADISDLDVYLDRLIGTTWTRMASSAGGSSHEIISLLKPEDGTYRIGVDNYSGPAGTFTATFDIVQGSDLALAGLTNSAIAANTPVQLTLSWNKELQPGRTYKGTILLGPSTAPTAMEIPVLITKVSKATLHMPLIVR